MNRNYSLLDLSISRATRGALWRAGIFGVDSLCECSPERLRSIHGIGKKRLNGIINALAEINRKPKED